MLFIWFISLLRYEMQVLDTSIDGTLVTLVTFDIDI